ncbi:hypothetical protein BKA65DRAFT_559365 [Rhexocercosporidium sp. MPI-PUGE-AT-0058]|nr:hypothetical protein BKA65DRAFT_559365 [Rhexocercosporidium sp. MPI-PUGE-AT-0058]
MASKSTTSSNDRSSNSNSNSATNANQTSTTAPTNPADKSDYQWLKDAGYKNMYHFMLSYGLKMHGDDDYEEGKAILKGMREGEQANYEQEGKW